MPWKERIEPIKTDDSPNNRFVINWALKQLIKQGLCTVKIKTTLIVRKTLRKQILDLLTCPKTKEHNRFIQSQKN